VLLTEHHAMKAYWGSGGIAARILDLGTRWRWAVSFTPRPLYPQGKSPWYPLDRRLGGTRSLSGCGGEEKNSQLLPGLETPNIQLVAQRCITELCKIRLRDTIYTFQMANVTHSVAQLYTTELPLLLPLFLKIPTQISKYNYEICKHFR
jgi:hypothetical protein